VPLLIASKPFPGLELEEYGHFFRVVSKGVIPAETYLVLAEITGRRPDMLLKVFIIEVEAVYLLLRVFTIPAAELP